LRSNIYKQHPKLRSIRKRPPKKPKKPPPSSNRRRINIVPTNVGMIMLSNFESDGSGDDEEEDSQPRLSRMRSNVDDSDMDDEDGDVSPKIFKGKNEKEEDTDGVIPEDYFDYEDEDESDDGEKNENGLQCEKISKNGKTESGNDDEKSDEDKEESDDDESKPSLSRPWLGFRLSQQYSRIEQMRALLKAQICIDQTQRLESAVTEMEQSTELSNEESSNKKIKTNCEDEDSSENKIESIEDKDESSDEDSEEEGMAITDVYNIHHRAKKTSRCLSNNSAETSETSGIGSFSDMSAFGSFVDDHMAEIINGRSSQKNSPNESSPERSCCNQILEEDEIDHKTSDNNNDIDEGIVKDEDKDVSVPDVEEDSEPKENVKKYMREKIYQLPLPEAMKAYLNYYRK
jgi:hypothetical protein